MGPRADNISHLPPDIADGEVSEEEAQDLERLAESADQPPEQRLEEFAEDKTRPDEP